MHRGSSKERDLETVALLALLACGLLLRAAAIAALPLAPVSDELAYQSMAQNLIAGHGIVDSYGNRAFYNMGYSLFVLAPGFLLTPASLLGARALNLVLGGVSILLCHAVAREAGLNRIGRLLAAGIWAFDLSASVYTVYLDKENLMAPLMLGAIWCALRMAKQPSWNIAALCGVVFGLLALVGNAALSLSAAVVVGLYFAPATLSRKIATFVLVVLVAAAVTAPWLARNRAVLGSPVLNTNGGFNLYLGNNPAADGWFISVGETPHRDDWNPMRKASEVKASQTLGRDAVAWIEAHPAKFLSLAARKAVYFWTPPVHEGQGPQSRTEHFIRILWAIQFFFVTGAALFGLLLRRCRNRNALILWAAILGYTSVHMLFYVIFRYRLPIMPEVSVLAAMTGEAAIGRLQAVRRTVATTANGSGGFQSALKG